MSYRLKVFMILLLLTSLSYSQIKFTARELHPKADSIALEYLTSSCLADVISYDVDSTGRSEYWIFKHDSLNVYCSLDSINVEPSNLYMATGWGKTRNEWIDSDSALLIAETNGGRFFRHNNPAAKISAWLFGDSASPFPFWVIKYSSESSNNAAKITLNANDGSIWHPMSVDGQPIIRQKKISLYQNYPNPFNSTTTISYTLDKADHISLYIYNISGQHLATLVNGYKLQGSHKVVWQARNFPTGIYLYQIQTSEFKTTRKLILQR